MFLLMGLTQSSIFLGGLRFGKIIPWRFDIHCREVHFPVPFPLLHEYENDCLPENQNHPD